MKAKHISVRLRQFKADQEAIDTQYADLLKKYPHKWVGVYKGKMVIAGSLEGLCESLGEDSPYAATRYLNPTPPTLVLPFLAA